MRKIALVTLMGLLIVSCSSEPPKEDYKSPIIPVYSADVEKLDIPLYFEAIGTLKPALSVEIRPQASGMMQAVHFNEGQDVKKGQRLFTIDSDAYAIRLQEAEAQFSQNQIALDISRKKLDRYNSLAKKDLISQQEWEELNALVAKNEAQLQVDQARLAAVKLDLKYCLITAPMDGKTGKIAVHPGNLVGAAQPVALVTLTNVKQLLVEFALTEREFQQLSAEHLNGSFVIEVISFSKPDLAIKGTLAFMDHSFDAHSGLLHFGAEILNDQLLFLPGQTVKVRLPISTITAANVVPQKSVKINQSGPYVYLVKENNIVEIRQVRLGEELENKIVVLEGLNFGDKVITDGHLRLAPGMTVEIKKEQDQL